MSDERRLAEVVRAACIKAALDAYEDGGILGLCAEGRWEYAISAMQQLDVDALATAAYSTLSPVEKQDDKQAVCSPAQPL